MTLTARFRAASRFFALAPAVGVTAWGQPTPPRVFYSDSVSAPNSGMPKRPGAFVTKTGRYFGGTRGGSAAMVGRVTVEFSSDSNHIEGTRQVYGNTS